MTKTPAPGEHYYCVICRSCGRNTPVAPDPSGGKAAFSGAPVIHAECRRCGATHEYERRLVDSVRLTAPL